MVRVDLDADGRLRYFESLPPQQITNPEKPAPAVDWSPLFAAADLDVRS